MPADGDQPRSGEAATLGVVGGGQLGRMIAEAAGPLGVDCVVLDPTPDCPAATVARDQVRAGFDDSEGIAELAHRADAVTVEIELAGPDALRRAGDRAGVPVHPAPRTLEVIRDKLVQKRRLREAGVPVPEFRAVEDPADLRAALDELGTPAMVKARTGGYDGRGNVPVEDPDDSAAVLEAIGGPAMVEAFVEYDRELSVIAARGDGEVATYEPGENVHREEILRETVVPARTTDRVRDRADAVAREVLAALEGRGVFGIELFEADGEVLVNEVAPRPHNSGHWTIEGAATPQFEQHVRAVLGWPLGATDRRGPTAMANVLGDTEERRPAALRVDGADDVASRGSASGDATPDGSSAGDATADGSPPPDSATLDATPVLERPGAHLHWYGKREVYPLRKMGHVTAVGGDRSPVDDPLETVTELRDALTFADASENAR